MLSQFRGYEQLEEFDWAGYRHRYGDISRLDRILEAEGDSTNRYKVSKQADVLMLFQLLDGRGVLRACSTGWATRTTGRRSRGRSPTTSTARAHGSTLSKVVHSWVLARSNRAKAWHYFLEALESDIADVQGGTTGEGIHLGAMAGTVDLLQRGVHRAGDPRGHAAARPVPARRARAACGSGCATAGTPRCEVAITHDRHRRRQPPRAAVLPVRVGNGEYRLDPRGSLEVPLHPARDHRP